MEITTSIDSLINLVSDFFATFGIVGAVVAPLILTWIGITGWTFFHEPSSPDARKRRGQ